MNAERRRREVVATLARDGEVTVTALARRFTVSEMTVRRDLEALEAKGTVRRVRGGAITAVSRAYEPPLALRSTEAAPAKQAIGRAAAALIADGETAVVDVGTTTLELARALRGRRGVTIVTPSLLVAAELGHEPDMRVLLTGGWLRPGEMSLVGAAAEEVFATVNCDVAFIGVAGIDVAKGITEYNLDDTRVKRAAMTSARRSVVLADATKCGRVAFATVAPLADVDVLVTDAAEDEPVTRALTDQGAEVVRVAREEAGTTEHETGTTEKAVDE